LLNSEVICEVDDTVPILSVNASKDKEHIYLIIINKSMSPVEKDVYLTDSIIDGIADIYFLEGDTPESHNEDEIEVEIVSTTANVVNRILTVTLEKHSLTAIVIETIIVDTDNDGTSDSTDNCPETPNPGQEDDDNDGIGDVCDNCPNDSGNDTDDDDVCNDEDNCPDVPNPGQEDADNDGLGDACDDCLDGDEDGVCDDIDNCPNVSNPGQEDDDNDGIGDACDNDASFLPSLFLLLLSD
jgi:hypothetical protein